MLAHPGQPTGKLSGHLPSGFGALCILPLTCKCLWTLKPQRAFPPQISTTQCAQGCSYLCVRVRAPTSSCRSSSQGQGAMTDHQGGIYNSWLWFRKKGKLSRGWTIFLWHLQNKTFRLFMSKRNSKKKLWKLKEHFKIKWNICFKLKYNFL